MRGAQNLMASSRPWIERIGGRSEARTLSSARVLPFVTALLAGLIFVADTFTSLEIAVAVFYVVVVLLSAIFARPRGVIVSSFGCVVLTVASYFLTPGGDIQAGLINTFISIVAIGSTTFLVLRNQSAQLAADDARTQLAHISRVTTLGELAASIAHEVNQPLGAIVTNGNATVRWLSIDPPNLSEAIKTLGYIVEDADRASQIIARLRRLTRRAPAMAVPVDVNDAIREIASLMQHEFRRHRIVLQLSLSDALPRARGDRVQVQQVVLNLLLNAVEAVTAVGDRSRELTIATALEDAKHVCVSVTDTGPGIEASVAERMFDAFYTTKPDGMGIGLAVTRSIVEAHGGRIQVKPNSPQGTTIQFTIPVARGVLPQ